MIVTQTRIAVITASVLTRKAPASPASSVSVILGTSVDSVKMVSEMSRLKGDRDRGQLQQQTGRQ